MKNKQLHDDRRAAKERRIDVAHDRKYARDLAARTRDMDHGDKRAQNDTDDQAYEGNDQGVLQPL